MRAAPPEKNDPKLVDAPNGNSQSLEKSGLKPKFALKKDFGRVPTYLNRMKMEAAEAARLWEAEQEAERNRKEAMILTQEERDNILQGLRENWTLVNQIYQGQSLLTDTLFKKQRKAKVEAQLKQLEKFIQMLEQHPVIYITDNPYNLF